MIQILRKIWNFSKREQVQLRQSMVAAILHAAFHALQFGAIYLFLEALLGEGGQRSLFLWSLALLLVSALGQILSQTASALRQTHAGYFMAAEKRLEMGEKLKRVPMGFFSRFHLGKLSALATTTLSGLEMWVPNIFVLLVAGVLSSCFFILSLFFFHPLVALVAVTGSLLFFFVTGLQAGKAGQWAAEIQPSHEELTKEILSGLEGMQVSKAYKLTADRNQRMQAAFERSRKAMTQLEVRLAPYMIAQGLVLSLTIFALLLLTLQLYFSGGIPLAKCLMMLLASFIIFQGLQVAGNHMVLLRIVESAIDALGLVQDLPDMKEGEKRLPLEAGDIVLDRVSFRYQDRSILQDISATLPAQKLTALVGPSGSGKTTLANLIARFWDVEQGSISIGGEDIRNYSLDSLMNAITMVFQDVYLFEDTIENNIRFGRPGASREEVEEAARLACCNDFISRLPEGYQTRIGQGGYSLSGGEKQRLSIARALLKQAPIVILDEATANIDPENEDKLQTAIENLRSQKTVLMIAHRLKTIRNADQILVLEKGRIVQRGCHEELLQQEGLYQELIQAKREASRWHLGRAEK